MRIGQSSGRKSKVLMINLWVQFPQVYNYNYLLVSQMLGQNTRDWF